MEFARRTHFLVTRFRQPRSKAAALPAVAIGAGFAAPVWRTHGFAQQWGRFLAPVVFGAWAIGAGFAAPAWRMMSHAI